VLLVYSAYDKEALGIVEAVFRVYRMYLLDCKCFLLGMDHATRVHLLKHPSDKLTYRQTHWVEKLIHYANLMRVFYIKGILNEADPVSRRPDSIPVDNMRRLDERLLWDGNVHGIDTNGNDPTLLSLSTVELLNGDEEFLSKLKGAYTSCSYLSNENIERD
jgi:hypothetical protein